MIARGGMGEIYLAQYQGVAGFEKKCVIKKIRSELSQEETFVERFLNEGRTLVALTHSNIVQIFDMGEVAGEYYLAMEYVEGADLRDLMRRDRPGGIPLNIAVAVALNVLRGLEYAHRAVGENGQSLGIVHRDVSPSNILISTEGDIKVIDFGIAKAKTIESCTGVVQGKFAYMSPEQARGEHLDARTDIFSLGIVLYEMLTGIRPFEGSSDLQSLERVKSEEPREIREIRHDVDESICKILKKALEKDANERYSSAGAFYDALASYAREAKLDTEQRTVAAYFKPLMQNDVMSMGIDAALDAMLDAQEFGIQSTATRTLSARMHPQDISTRRGAMLDQGIAYDETGDLIAGSAPGISRDSVDRRSGSTPGVLRDSVDRRSGSTPGISRDSVDRRSGSTPGISQSTPGIRLEAGGESGEVGAGVSGERLANSGANFGALSQSSTGELSVEAPKRESRFARTSLIVLIVIVVIVASYLGYRWREDTQARVDEVQETLEGLKNSRNVQAGADWQGMQVISDFLVDAEKGIPLMISTDPHQSTIYVVDGAYRDLNGKRVVLIPDQDVEIAIQAPGYETCTFRVEFTRVSDKLEKKIMWRNCRSALTGYSAEREQIEANLSLTPMGGIERKPEEVFAVAGSSDVEVKVNEGARGEHPAADAAQEMQADVGDEQNEKASGTAQSETASGKAVVAKGEEKPVEKNSDRAKKTAKVTEKGGTAEKAADKLAQESAVKVSVSSSVPAELIAAGKSTELPTEVELKSGTSIQVMPKVSGRKVAVPWKGVSSNKAIQVKFCEATVRIKESYAPGDPAPYQISDIYLDGQKVASKTDSVKLVLPCRKYELEAKLQVGEILLSSKETISVESGSSNAYALTLKAK